MAEAVLQGDLAAFRLPEVLTFLSAGRHSGMLLLAHHDREAYLYFDDGALVHANSNQEQFRLGSMLLRRKKITASQGKRIDELMQRDGGRFGELAIREGALNETQLLDFLKIQVSEVVFDAFVWDGGSFAFRLNARLPPKAVTIQIDLPNLIMEGARRIAEWEQCLKLLPNNNAIFRVVAAPGDDKITLTSEEWKILFLVNAQRTLDDLCRDAGEDPFHVYRVVYGLLANNLIEHLPRNTRSGDSTLVESASEGEDVTLRQGTPQLSADSTVREAPDDSKLLLSSDERLSYAEVVRPTVAQLRVVAVDGATRVITLTEPEYLIGRHRENSVQLVDLGVSGFHARIYRGPEGYVLEDLKSRNGSWINGARVFHASLVHGDTLHFGQTDITYEVLWAS